MGKSVVLVPMLATMLLFSQSERANLTGSVADPSGAVIAGAEVKVTHLATNTTAAVRTTTAGLQRVEPVAWLIPFGDLGGRVQALLAGKRHVDGSGNRAH